MNHQDELSVIAAEENLTMTEFLKETTTSRAGGMIGGGVGFWGVAAPSNVLIAIAIMALAGLILAATLVYSCRYWVPPQEIMAAYRQWAWDCHPNADAIDRKGTLANVFMKIHTTYSTLSDPQKHLTTITTSSSGKGFIDLSCPHSPTHHHRNRQLLDFLDILPGIGRPISAGR
ncbi:hypothetical protein NE237_016629 [Protea cynaroides]|uniref:Uncharacterized protein n=1 Tax=Protea cynaroides TaxID=273540 RepID=A0A9Q0HHG0_9MAGN|nr:hypothetical protein NE237_016629 [Protea cynaroides]